MDINSNESNTKTLIQTSLTNLNTQIINLTESVDEQKAKTLPLSKIKSINIKIMIVFILLIIIDFFYSYNKKYYHFLSFSYNYTNTYFLIPPFCSFLVIASIILMLLCIIYCMIYKSLFFKSFPNYQIIYGQLYPFSFGIFSLLIIIDLFLKFFKGIKSDDSLFTISDYIITLMIIVNIIIFIFIYIKIKKQETKNVFLVIPQNIFISLLLSLSIYLIFFYFILFIKSISHEELVNIFINVFIFIYFSLDIYFLIVYKDIIFTIQTNILEIGLIDKSDNFKEKMYLIIALLISFTGCFIYVKKYKKRVFGLQYSKSSSFNLFQTERIKNDENSDF